MTITQSGDQVVAYARTQVGYKEKPKNQTKYGAWYGMNGVAWCAIFHSYASHFSGNPLPPIRTQKGYAYCPDLLEYAQRSGQWHRAGTYTPKAGDAVLFSFGGQRADHVAIVVGVLNDGRIHTIEGNTNAAGSNHGGAVLEKYRRSSIIGYVNVKPKNVPPAIDWAALRRLLAGKLREQYGTTPNMGPGHPACCEVVALQQSLNLVTGSKLKEDGSYGPATANAVANFQRWMNGLGAGIKDPVGKAHEGTRWWLCVALQNIRDGKA